MSDLATDLTQERFSRSSTAAWWPTPRTHTDTEVMQYYRRLELEATDNQDDEESA